MYRDEPIKIRETEWPPRFVLSFSFAWRLLGHTLDYPSSQAPSVEQSQGQDPCERSWMLGEPWHLLAPTAKPWVLPTD